MKMHCIRRLLSYIRPYSGYLVLALISALASVAATLYVPVLIGRTVDVLVYGFSPAFWQLIAMLIGAIAIAALCTWALSFFTNVLTYKAVCDLRCALFEKIWSLPLSFVDRNAHGDIISRLVNDIDQVSDGLLQGFTQLFTGVITIIGTLVFMLMADKWITLLVVLMTPLSLFVAAFIAKKSFRHFRAQSKTQGELAGFIEEMVTNESLIKSFAREERCEAEFDEINARLYVSGQKSQFAASLSNPSTRFVNALVYAAVGVAGAISAINGRISIGQISMFLSYAHQYTKPFNEITGIITQLQSAMSSLIRVFDVFDKPPECADAALTAPAGDELVFNHVSFGYAPGKEIIHDLNLTVRAGTRVAIVGPTGCGKTTLINLILRFYEVNSGEITVGGAPIRDFPRDELRSRFGMVLQDSWLFGGTVRENIAFSRADATDYAIKRAAQDAYADSFISRLPNGYDTIISQDGSNISAGQRQLLSIARVMLADPPILILDEATSSIDTRTEQLISKAFDRMMAGRTSIVVAHRLSTIRSADMIYAVHGGRIVECGRHEELLAKGGFYADLYNSQFATA